MSELRAEEQISKKRREDIVKAQPQAEGEQDGSTSWQKIDVHLQVALSWRQRLHCRSEKLRTSLKKKNS